MKYLEMQFFYPASTGRPTKIATSFAPSALVHPIGHKTPTLRFKQKRVKISGRRTACKSPVGFVGHIGLVTGPDALSLYSL